MRLALALGGLLAAWCLFVPGSAAAAKPVPREFWGIAPQTQPTQSEIERMGRGRVGVLRTQVSWAAIEPEKPGILGPAYSWQQLDSVVTNAAQQGIEVLPFLYGTPRWVANGLDGSDCASDCYFEPPRTAAALDAWARFTRDLVERYGPGGMFWTLHPTLPRRPIRVWQIWNEQNSPTFFRPAPDVKDYAALLDRAAQAIRSRDGQATILLGGMFGTPLGGDKSGLTAWDYLAALYDVPGAASSFDVAAPHPYGARLKAVKQQLRRFRRAMRSAGDRATPLWVTEIGWASDGPDHPLNRGPNGQAKRLRQAFTYFRKERRKLKLENVTWYSWRDHGTEGSGSCAWCSHSGLFHENHEPKRAWRAYTRFTGGS